MSNQSRCGLKPGKPPVRNPNENRQFLFVPNRNPNRIHILYQEIPSPSRMANFTPLHRNACPLSPSGERLEATKRVVLSVPRDCAGERGGWMEREGHTNVNTNVKFFSHQCI